MDWKIVTEREIPYQKAKNIEWLYTVFSIENTDLSYELTQARDMLLQLLRVNEHSVVQAARIVEDGFILAAGTGLQLFKQLIINRAIYVNLNEPLNLNVKGIVA